ncbi:MAG: UDP-N-acetylmuramoyl-L-alanyl-D-glutamate--2,6-diaminopimelate ligase [Verrucomicrobiota bacterium]|nr:UDP-N-acetylmuramoyl-L-alanyl-D-glutamate--2,6-diaminopimelate ligase [Verrucomicrobiota bacterium]
MARLDALISQIEAVRVIGPAERDVSGIACDSRQVRPGFLFVAVAGTRQDGRSFVEDAIGRGAVAVVSECPAGARNGGHVPSSPNGSVEVSSAQGWRGRRNDVCLIKVRDAHLALGILAAAFHNRPSDRLEAIGVTGTNGKTTIAYLARDILRADGRKPAMLSTVEYQIGARQIPASRTTPDAPTLQAMLAEMVAIGCRSVVMEVSSHALDQKRTDGVDYDVAVFTNLTRDHLDYHRTVENYFEAKARLFRGLGSRKTNAAAVVNLDDPRGSEILGLVPPGCRRLTYGLEKPADVRADNLALTYEGSRFLASTPWGAAEMRVPLIGRHNASNALAVVAVCGALGVGLDRIARTLADPTRPPGRLDEVRATRGFQVFIDYAHTDDALRRALEALREIARGRLIAVFGCGGDRDKTKRPLMGAVAARLADHTVLTSDNPRTEDPLAIIAQIREGFGSATNVEVEADRAQAIRRAVAMAGHGDIVLIAGKGHETFQEFGNRTIPFEDRAVARSCL